MTRRIQLFMIRHSKSCSNHMRIVAGTEDERNPLVQESKELLDPELSENGKQIARQYSPILHKKLVAAGINPETALIGTSGLQRAQQTAQMLFPDRRIHHLPHIKEHGNIPENTPTTRQRCKPDWRAFLRHLHGLSHTQFVIVGHGSYLRKDAWPTVSKRPHARFGNLDGFLIEATLTPTGQLKGARVTDIPYHGPTAKDDDQCSVGIERIIATHTRKMPRHHHRSHKTRKQHGGGVSMPLAYFHDGAQMRGTYADATGVGLGAASAGWARAAIDQTGGRRSRKQHGGFTPSVMGAFVANGARLLPTAAYVGYKMYTNQPARRSRKHRGGARRRTHRSH